ncbi:hypothetical protein MP228_002582 [Amoeboaphelidium protococcarum]|nr:hypothetical protein MP228_002582 [Amoeboaphelidium protococcarum]
MSDQESRSANISMEGDLDDNQEQSNAYTKAESVSVNGEIDSSASQTLKDNEVQQQQQQPQQPKKRGRKRKLRPESLEQSSSQSAIDLLQASIAAQKQLIEYKPIRADPVISILNSSFQQTDDVDIDQDAAAEAISPIDIEDQQYIIRLLSQKLPQEQRSSDFKPAHKSGSARTEGYYVLSKRRKLQLSQERRQASQQNLDDDNEVNGQDQLQQSMQQAPLQRLATSRDTRLTHRRFAAGLEDAKQTTNSEVLSFNKLKGRKKHLKFCKSAIHDWGLYAEERIEKGEMIIEYIGEIVRQKIADIREKEYEKIGIGSSYLFRMDEDQIVDATLCGNLARFINHCCDPNCIAKIISINGEKKIVIYAKEDIEVGQEITYDYKFPVEDDKIPCLCGSPNCRGTLN